MAVKFNIQKVEATLADAVEQGFADIEELASEMEEVRSNLEEKFSQTERYARYEEAATLLQEIVDNKPEVPDDLNGEGVAYHLRQKKSKKSPYPRWLRLENASAALEAARDGAQAVHDYLEERLNELENDEDQATDDDMKIEGKLEAYAELTKAEAESLRDTCQELADALEEAVSNAGGVEFPGMYG